MIRKGSRVADKDGQTGTVISDVTYRTTGRRSLPQVKVRWDVAAPSGDTEWNVLTRNIKTV